MAERAACSTPGAVPLGIKVMQDLIHQSKQDLDDNRNRFIPRGALFRYLNQETVADIMKPYLESHQSNQSLLQELVRDLTTRLGQSTEGFPTKFKGLPDTDKQLFFHFTWQLRSPYIESFHQIHGALEPQSQITLPWTYLEPGEDLVAGKVTLVRRIKIDPDHHDIGEKDGDFALKTFVERRPAKLAETSFQIEVNANREVRGHERIVPLLAAIRHRERFYLLFPWAEGGNLQDLWKHFAASLELEEDGQTIASWYTPDWLMDQCLGIAEAIAVTHGFNVETEARDVPAYLHGDIKPENILCFAREKGGYTAKLADFGEAQEIDHDTNYVNTSGVAHVKTYLPPEYDMEENVTLAFDVWCLGCVYLEFITWALEGNKGIEEFKDAREEEGDDLQVRSGQGMRIQDTFFKKVLLHPRAFGFSKMKFDRKYETIYDEHAPKRIAIKRRTWSFQHSVAVGVLLKDKVKLHIEALKTKAGANPQLQGFLHFIGSKMLVVDTKSRATSYEVRAYLQELRAGQN